MPDHATVSASNSSADERLSSSRLRDARIRTKLALILLIPLVAIGALATARLVEGGTRAFEADLVRSLAEVSVQASEVGHRLHQERIEAVRLLSDAGGDAAGFNRQSARTDDAVLAYQATVTQLGRVPEVIEQRLAAVDEHLAGLGALRQQILGEPPVTTSAAVLRYGAIRADIGAYQDALAGAIEDPGLSEQTRAVAAIASASTHAADAEAIAQAAAAAGGPTQAQREALRATLTGQQEAFLAFRQAAPPQRAIGDRAITGANVAAAETAAAELLQDQPLGELAAAAAGFAGMVDVTRFVEAQLLEQLLESVTQTRNSVIGRVLAESGFVVAAVVVAILVTVMLARMLARSLHRLRASAVAVAQHELPAAVQRVSDPHTLAEHSPAELAAQVRVPPRLRSRDEIGDVAQALYQVHQVAVRTAAEQAALRTSVAEMFLNLARRSQTLVDNMITRLDRLQRDEQDQDKLRQMFALDNLATRMRRNDENLLVLTGADSSSPRSTNAQVADVLQAAQSEIEAYQRVEFGTVDDDVQVVAGAINDVVRLVAELLDNATRFSRPEAAVLCEARRLGDQLIIQIEDRGLGMSQDDVEAINTWLSRPGELDVTSIRRMGVAVIARLAARHQIRVKIQAHPHYGTTATVTLPPATLVLPASRQHAFALHSAARPVAAVQLPPSTLPPASAQRPGQLPQRSGEVVRHAAGRHPGRTDHHPPAPPRQSMASPAELPVAGRPAHLAAGHDQPPSPQPGIPTIELPIFQQVQTWFGDQDDHDPTWTHDQPPAAAHPTPTPPRTQHPTTTAAQPFHPTDQPVQTWRTAADDGWAAAAAAATPNSGGATLSGLPRRVPAAQLVPGGVQPPPTAVPAQRRTPEQIRGLLSAYQRGVQRGRESWAA